MNFQPSVECYQWNWFIVVPSIITDIVIFLAHLGIVTVLIKIIKTHRAVMSIRLNAIFWLFVFFITSCGTSYLIDALTVFTPIYSIKVGWGFLTAILSLFTGLKMVTNQKELEKFFKFLTEVEKDKTWKYLLDPEPRRTP